MPIYYGVSGKARKVTGGYYGVNGKSELIIGDNEVPSEYIQFKYFYRTTQAAYITIPVTKIDTFTQVICNFAYNKISHADSANYERIFTLTGNYYAEVLDKCYIKKGTNSYYSDNLVNKQEYTINLTKNLSGDCYFDNKKIFTNIDTDISNSSLTIFQYKTALSGVAYISGLELYDLTSQKSLLRLIPCVKIENTVPGFYDTINKKFYSDNVYSQYFRCTNEL